MVPAAALQTRGDNVSKSHVSKSHVSPADCTGATMPGNTNYAGYDGALLPSATGATYTLSIVSNPGGAGISYILANSGRPGAIDDGASTTFGTPDNSGVFIYASSNGDIGYFPLPSAPLQFCKTNYGWLLQIDTGDKSYSTLVTFIQN